MSATDAVALMLSFGFTVDVEGPQMVRVDGLLTLVRSYSKPPSPTKLEQFKDAAETRLLVTPRMTKSLAELAHATDRIAVVSPSEDWLIFRQQEYRHPPEEEPTRTAPRGRVPWTRFGLLRALARTSRPRTQVELAAELNTTQVSVSLAMKQLGDLARRTKHGWLAADVRRIARAFLDEYPGPKGITQHWLSTETPVEQLSAVRQLVPDALVSGDVAADMLAPWRISRQVVVVYVDHGVDLSTAKIAKSGPRNASLSVVVPADPTIRPLAKAYGVPGVVDPLVCAFDVAALGGTDSGEAVEHLLARVERDWRSNDST